MSSMNNRIRLGACGLMALGALALTGCEDQVAEIETPGGEVEINRDRDIGNDIEDGARDAGDALERGLDRTGDALEDAGDAIRDRN